MSLAILCPGQGAQHSAMLDILAGNDAAQAVLEAASTAAEIDLVAVVRSKTDIFANHIAQPLICAYNMAAWAALAPLLPVPVLFAGYSVGELAAYGCAGSLSISETIRLALERAALMNAASPEAAGLVAVLGLTRRQIDALCVATDSEIAIVNGDEHFVVGGTVAALDRCSVLAVAGGAKVQRLSVSVPAHTSLLTMASTHFRSVLESSSLDSPTIPVLAGVSGAAVSDRRAVIDSLSRQISTTVQWSACLDAAVERGCRAFLELGPGDGLARMVRERFPSLAARSLANFRSLKGSAEWVMRALE